MVELLGEGQISGVVGGDHLALADHVDEFDAAEDDGGRALGLEAEHRADPALDAPMVLLDPVVHVPALPDLERLCVRPVPHPHFSVAFPGRFQVGLAAVDGYLHGQAMARIGPAEETLRVLEVARNRKSTVAPLLSIARYR